ncbi:hypothetical protein TNCV_4565442 [Trichonephila clavipes]|nr:hypothetical protein TNCV_4565442 [Trichonephila clavipes]
MKENSWKEIGLSLGLSGDLCLTRFDLIRKRLKYCQVEPKQKHKKFGFFSDMLCFLDPYMQKGRKQRPNSRKIKRAKEEFIDAALMKIGGETDP